MTRERSSRLRAFARHGAVLVSAGAVIAAMNIAGIGAPQPGFSAPGAQERASPTASRSLPDRIEAQAGIVAGERDTPFTRIATGTAQAPPRDDAEREGGGEVCISSPLVPGTFRISSGYGPRAHPLFGRVGIHAGVDLAAPLGTPIHAVAAGTVSYTGPGRAGRSSELLIIDHEVDGMEFSSWYVHMYPDGVFVEAGQDVRAGERVAEVGTNGNSTGPHLHLEIHTKAAGGGGAGTSLGRVFPIGAAPTTPTPSPSSTPSETADDSSDAAASSGARGAESTPAPEETSRQGDESGEGEPPPEGHDPEEKSEDPDDSENPDSSENPGESDPPAEPADGDPSAPAGQEDDPDAAPEDGDDPSEKEAWTPVEEDDEGLNDHAIEDTISRHTGVFDPGSLGFLHDPFPFLQDLGYGLAAPSVCGAG